VLGVLLEEVLAWVRSLPGSSRIRALITTRAHDAQRDQQSARATGAGVAGHSSSVVGVSVLTRGSRVAVRRTSGQNRIGEQD